MPPHNLPLAVFPHPDIREAKFSTELLAIFVFACLMVISISNHQVLAVHVRFKGHTTRTGERLGLLLHVSESALLIENDTVGHGVGKVVGPDLFQEFPIFCGVNYAPFFRELRNLFRDLFDFVSRLR